MPGPSNAKRKPAKSKKKKAAKSTVKPTVETTIVTEPSIIQSSNGSSSSPSPDLLLLTPPPLSILSSSISIPDKHPPSSIPQLDLHHIEEVLCQKPFIHDPGNGPRVRDTRAFLASSYFSQPPALDIPLCAEFAQDEVLQMLCTVLPEETALILWYNKSRATSRICPACQRLYHLGDTLPDLVEDEYDSAPPSPTRANRAPPPQLGREQSISGLCSPVCFILASFNHPGAIKSAWGRMADEMDDASWELLNAPGVDAAQGDTSRTLGMLVKMTRLHDLGLAQLCFDEAEVEFLEERRDADEDVNPQGFDEDTPSELDLGLALKALALVDQS